MYRKWKARLLDRSGFTLLEMVLATALVSIFFTMAAMLLPTWYRAYAQAVELNHARQISDSVLGSVEQQLRFANHVEVETDAAGVERISGKAGGSRFHIPMEDSTNLIDGLVYDEDFFMNHDIELSFSLGAAKEYCTVRVTVTRKEGAGTKQVLTRERAVSLSGEND